MCKQFFILILLALGTQSLQSQCSSEHWACPMCTIYYDDLGWSTGFRTAFNDAANRWNTETCGYLAESSGGFSDGNISAQDIDQINCTNYTGHPAETYTTLSGNHIVYCQTYLNNNSSAHWSTSGNPEDGELDVESVMVHEFGHWFGLNHVDNYYSTMGRYTCGTVKTDITNDCISCLEDLCGTWTSVEDGIWIAEDLDHYDVNHTYVGYIHRNFVDVSPPGDYIVTWDNWKITASYGCGEVQLYDGSSGDFVLQNLPDGYLWERDVNGYVIGTLSTGGTDNDGFHHTASIPIKIGNVPNTFITSGTLTSDTYWCGNISLTGTVTVPSGLTLTVYPGAVIKFPSNASLIVQGKLVASNCTFTSQSGTTPNSWGSIELNGSGASGSIISISNINYGNQVQIINVPNFEITHCLFTDNYESIYVSGSSGTIQNNYITSSSYGHGIEIANSSTVDCRKNTIKKTNNTGVGILYGGGSNGNVWQNDINGCDWGVGAIWGSSPDWYNTNYLNEQNDIRNNRVTYCNDGVMVYIDSYPTVGLPIAAYGVSSIHNNSVDIALNTTLGTTSNLNAEEIYWNNGNPANAVFQIGSGSTISTSPYYQTDPWASYPLPSIRQSPNNVKAKSVETLARVQTNINSRENSPDVNINSINGVINESADSIFVGINFRHQKKLKQAKDYFLSYLSKHPDNQRAYVELYNCADSETTLEIVKFFETLPKQAAKEQELLLAYLYLKQGNVDLAKKVNNSIITENANTSLSERAMINNAYIALFNDNNLNEAVKIYGEVLNRSELSTPLELSSFRDVIENYAKTHGQNKIDLPVPKKAKTSGEDTPKEYALLGNYPNPFNPTTTIVYNLPQTSKVEVIIYDMLGKEVRSFNISSQPAGKQQITWDGRNNNNEQVTSGIYIYRLKATSMEVREEIFIKSAKFILLK